MKSGAKNKKKLDLFEEGSFLKVFRALGLHHAKYLVIGGVALNLHGLLRATRDIDILIPKDVKNTQAVLDALKDALTFGIAGEIDAQDVASKPITIIGDVPRVDLFTVAKHVKYEGAAKTANHVKIDGVRINYVDLETLIKSKDTDRLQDRADIERLKRIRRK